MNRYSSEVIESGTGPLGHVGMFAIRDRVTGKWVQGHLYRREATAQALTAQLNVSEAR